MRILNTLAKIPRKLRPRSYPLHSVASTQGDILKEFTISPNDLKLAYLSHPVVNRALHFRADLIVARGFTIDFSDEKTKEIIGEFLNNIKLNSPTNADLKTMIRNACIDTDVFGNSYYQLITNRKKNKIVKLAPRHPVNMDFQRDNQNHILLDNYGEPLGYAFKMEQGEVKFKRQEIAHLVFETLGDEFLGVPLLLPMFKTIERLANIEFAMAQALYKHGLPTRDIIVGNSDHSPSIQDIDDAAKEVQNIDRATEFTHPYWMEVKTIEPKWPSNVQNVPEFYLNAIVSASGIPKRFLLGEEKFAATTMSLQRNLSLMLDPLQSRVKSWVEEQIFRPVLDLEGCDGIAELVWANVLQQAEPGVVKDTIALANTVLEGKPLITWSEARQRLKLPATIAESEVIKLSIPEDDYPGIYLVEPHGELIWRRRKRAIVKSRKFSNHVGEPLYLLSGKQCYGIIKLDSPTEINLQQFKELAPKHLVKEEERLDWWPGKQTLFYYPFVIEELYKVPRKWKYEPGVQTFVRHVEFE